MCVERPGSREGSYARVWGWRRALRRALRELRRSWRRPIFFTGRCAPLNIGYPSKEILGGGERFVRRTARIQGGQLRQGLGLA